MIEEVERFLRSRDLAHKASPGRRKGNASVGGAQRTQLRALLGRSLDDQRTASRCGQHPTDGDCSPRCQYVCHIIATACRLKLPRVGSSHHRIGREVEPDPDRAGNDRAAHEQYPKHPLGKVQAALATF